MTSTVGIHAVPLTARHVEVPGGPLAVAEVAAAEPHGLPALFVPGYTGSKEDFALIAHPVADSGHPFLAVDLRGQHESPGPDDPAAYTVDALATDLRELVLALGLPAFHLVGHSFGGLVCRAAVLAGPDIVASLTLMSSGPSGLRGPRVDRMQLMEPMLQAVGMEGLFDAMSALDPRRTPDDPLTLFLRRRWLSSSVAGLRGMGLAVTEERDRVDELRDLGIPLFVVYGENDDAWTPGVQRSMAERLGVAHVEIPAAAHSPAAEAPEATAAALREFWATVESG